MKRLLIPLLAALALPTAVNAEISDKVHERCEDAKDYVVRSNYEWPEEKERIWRRD